MSELKEIKCKQCNKTVIMLVDEDDFESELVQKLAEVPCSKCVPTSEFIKFLTDKGNKNDTNN